MKKAENHVWLCTVKGEKEARTLEEKYHVSLKQHTEEGIRLRILREKKPEGECRQAEATLEDAYILATQGDI